ncbi:hypothetical protein KBC04_04925 [Candidatus Babeliales bacterium]|nr:hypothetical protein [Candidatus Babeliales bacterium]MBP9844324.1 hypothetical protein [Candidatus Babeliales bacterium]
MFDTGKFHQEKFVIHAQDVKTTIVFMPLKKRVVDKKTSPSPIAKKGGSSRVMSHNEYTKKLEEQKKKASVVPQVQMKAPEKAAAEKKVIEISKPKVEAKVIKAAVPVKKSPTTLQSVAPKKPIAKASIEPAVKKPATKNIAVKTVVKKAEKEVKSPEVKKNIEEKTVIELKKVEPTPEIKKQDEIKIEPVLQQVQVTEQIIAPQLVTSIEHDLQTPIDEEDQIDLENVSFVGSLDHETMQIRDQIQIEISKYYRPPVGMSKYAACELAVVVGLDGKADRVIIKKNSGSVANDICARVAVLKSTFPKEVIGKEIIIDVG